MARELGIFGGDFQILDAVSLSANEISGADYVMVTLKSPDGKICQLTLNRNLGTWGRWEINHKSLKVMQAPKPGEAKVPKWMDDAGVTPEQL